MLCYNNGTSRRMKGEDGAGVTVTRQSDSIKKKAEG